MDNDGKIYVLRYDPETMSFESLAPILKDTREAMQGIRVIALPNGVDMHDFSMNTLVNTTPRYQVTFPDEPKEITAEWRIWAGWKGNHDQRIDNATCTNCDYVHPTVYRSVGNLSPVCPGCHAKITGVRCEG